VTVEALAPPRAASPPPAREVTVAGEMLVDMAPQFTGVVATYTATSSDTAVVTATVDGSVVSLGGVAVGAATVTVTATNGAGSVSGTFPVTVTAADELSVAIAAPAYCLGSEGAPAPGGGRRGVGSMDVTYAIRGGVGPYTITSPDAPTETHSALSGAFRVSCARRGVDLASVGADVNVVEAGPRTVRVTVTDSAGATVHADARVEVAEDAYTTEYNGGTMRAGRTYVLGTTDEWVLITLPAGLKLRFKGLSEGPTAHFEEITSGAEIVLDWTTGEEINRTIPPPATPQDPNAATGPHPSAAQLSALTATVQAAPRGSIRNTINGTDWRPYGDRSIGRMLRHGSPVGVHPKMRSGERLVVCTPANNSAFKDLVKYAAEAWNTAIRNRNTDFDRDVFFFHKTCPDRDDDIDVRVNIAVDTSTDWTCEQNVPGCAETVINGDDPPTVTGKEIHIRLDHAPFGGATVNQDHQRRVMIHELGHFLGLGDYGECGSERFHSVMAGGDCLSVSITGIDLSDLHAIYHPGARTGMYFARGNGLPIDSSGWRLFTGSAPEDINGNSVSNAASYLVFGRRLDSRMDPELVAEFGRETSTVYPDDAGNKKIGRAFEQIRGHVFFVFGVTRGDIDRLSRGGIAVHHIQRMNLMNESGEPREWTLGAPAVVYGPPTIPEGVTVKAGPRSVQVVWDGVLGATDYDVYWAKRPIADPPPGGVNPRNYLRVENVAFGYQSARLGINIVRLDDDTTYYFRVRANQVVPHPYGGFHSGLSVQASAMPRADLGPLGVPPGTRLRPGGARRPGEPLPPPLPGPTNPPPAPAPPSPTGRGLPAPVKVPLCLPMGFVWVVRAVGDWFVCERSEVAAAVPVRVSECSGGFASLTPSGGSGSGVLVCVKTSRRSAPTRTELRCPAGYERVYVPLGAEYCRLRVTVRAAAETTFECPQEYTPVGLGVPSCSRLVSERATVRTTHVCPAGYARVQPPLGNLYCRRTASEEATATTTYDCPAGYTLLSLQGRHCHKRLSEAARASTRYVCPAGYALVFVPLGARYCRKTLTRSATATFSCSSGYTRSGRTCWKYVYTAPRRGRCPAGYSWFYNGVVALCRKKLTTAATVTYTCPDDYARSGRTCTKTLTASPTTITTYSCRDRTWTLSGRTCTKTLTTTPIATTTYSCRDDTWTRSRLTCTKTLTTTPTATHSYSCRDDTWTRSRLTCTKTLTAIPKATTTYTCRDHTWTRSGRTCTKTLTATPRTRTVHYCQPAETRETIDVGPTTSVFCTLTTTAAATTTTTYRCPTVAPGEPRYRLTTRHVGATTTRTCTRTITEPATENYRCEQGTLTTTHNGAVATHTCQPDND